MNAGIVIAIVTLLVALGSFWIRPKEDFRWVKRLNQPRWLSIVEPAIPVIWTVIFTCGAISAWLVWRADPGSFKTWLILGFYLLVEIVTTAYVPITLRLRSLAIGTVIGGLGAVLGYGLAIVVFPISPLAAVLLLPYLLWSPIGTYATRELIDFNPESI